VVEADEEAFERMLLERAEQLRKHHAPALGGCAKSHPATIDAAQTRAAMRALGSGKIVVTPTDNGWSFSGDGNLAGMVGGALGSLRGSPRFPPVARYDGTPSRPASPEAGAALEIARSRAPRLPLYARRFFAKKSVQRFQASAAAAAL